MGFGRLAARMVVDKGWGCILGAVGIEVVHRLVDHMVHCTGADHMVAAGRAAAGRAVHTVAGPHTDY